MSEFVTDIEVEDKELLRYLLDKYGTSGIEEFVKEWLREVEEQEEGG